MRCRGAHRFFKTPMEIDIEQIVDRVIEENEAAGRLPQCDLHDIFRNLEDGVKAEMRRLIMEGKYQGSITINKVPVLRRREE